MKINGSPDITQLNVAATFDISGVTPVITLENLSSGNSLATVSYAFVVKSPTQTLIHEGDITNPDVTGLWNTHIISDPWPRPFGNIEWSGAPYTFQVIIKDSNNTVFYGDVQEAPICHPNGNTQASKNPYGVADVLVEVKCDMARIYFKNQTNSSYRGDAGELQSSVLRVNFPMDEQGIVPPPFVGSNFSTALVPITYSGKGYQFLSSQIYLYEVSENTFVKIKYIKSDTFGVWCNIDLYPLCCEIQKLIDSLENGTCADAESASEKLLLINSKFALVVMGMLQPLTGIDVPALIQEIETIGGFECDCCNAPTGIVPVRSSNLDGYSFELVPLGGDIEGNVQVNGYNVQIRVGDLSYVFEICDGSPAQTTAFEVRTALNGFTKTYCLHVEIPQLAEDILNAIKVDANLVNLFNSIVLSAGDGNFQLVVDGGCIFSNSNSCDYTFTLDSIPVAGGTFAILATVQTSQQTHTLNYAFNLGNLTQLQTALNALGIGSWVVNNPSGQTVVLTVTSATNITQLIYKNPTALVADMIKQCTGYIPLSANQVVQNIINYLCGIDDSQVAITNNYQICYIDPADSTQKVATVLAGAPLNQFIIELLARGCQTINYIAALGAVNCQAMLQRFPSSVVAMQANDIFLVTKGGQCSQVNPIEAFYTMLTYGILNADVKQAFCNFVAACAGGLPCAPYDYFFVTINEGSPNGDEVELVVTFSHPEAIAHNIRYARIDNTNNPVYVTITGILPGDSPYLIATTPALEGGQYRVFIKPIYADGRACDETMYETAPCTGINSFSAAYDSVGGTINVAYTADPTLPAVRVNITFPNGGSSSTVYTNGDVIQITPPPNVFGTFFATMQPVCNVNTGWYGAPSSVAAFIINPPNNSALINNSSFDQFTVQVYSITPNQTQLATQTLDAGDTQPFYLADGTYGYLFLLVDTADRDNMSLALVTGTGSYTASRVSTNLFAFSGIAILNGATLTLTDDASPTADNFTLSASYNYSIDSASGSGVPPLDPTGINGTKSGTQSGITGIITVVISSSMPAPNTKLDLVINNVTVVDCQNITGDGTYFLNAGTILSTDDVRISVNGGSC